MPNKSKHIVYLCKKKATVEKKNFWFDINHKICSFIIIFLLLIPMNLDSFSLQKSLYASTYPFSEFLDPK